MKTLARYIREGYQPTPAELTPLVKQASKRGVMYCFVFYAMLIEKLPKAIGKKYLPSELADVALSTPQFTASLQSVVFNYPKEQVALLGKIVDNITRTGIINYGEDVIVAEQNLGEEFNECYEKIARLGKLTTLEDGSAFVVTVKKSKRKCWKCDEKPMVGCMAFVEVMHSPTFGFDLLCRNCCLKEEFGAEVHPSYKKLRDFYICPPSQPCNAVHLTVDLKDFA